MIYGAERTLSGTLSMSRCRSNVEDDYVEIRVEDKNSRCQAFTVKLSMAEFAQFASFHASECEYALFDNADILGKRMEVRSVRIQYKIPKKWSAEANDKAAQAAAKKFEVDGWIADPVQSAINGSAVLWLRRWV